MRDSFLYPSIIDGKKNPPNWVSNQQKKFAKSSTNSPYNFHIILNRPRAFDDYSAPRLAACEETRAAGHEKTRHCMLVLSISSVRNSKIHGFLRLLWKKCAEQPPWISKNLWDIHWPKTWWPWVLFWVVGVLRKLIFSKVWLAREWCFHVAA